jgi:hypothetical protein
MRSILIALTLCTTFAAPAFALDYYFIAKDAQGKCHVFTGTNPNDSPPGTIGSYKLSREDAEKAMAAEKECAK